MLDESATPGSFYEARIDADAIGTSGHSAGGLWALTAAARDPRQVQRAAVPGHGRQVPAEPGEATTAGVEARR